jgi:hypothetical protein
MSLLRYVVITLCRYYVMSLLRYVVITLCRYYVMSLYGKPASATVDGSEAIPDVHFVSELPA